LRHDKQGRLPALITICFRGDGAHREFCGSMTLPCPRKPSHKSTGEDNGRAEFNDAPLNGFTRETVFWPTDCTFKINRPQIMDIDSFSALRLPREILFGENQVAALGKMSSRLGNLALVCTDTRFSGTPAFKDICRHLEDASIKIEVFDRAEPDVPYENAYQSVESARAFGALKAVA